MSRLLKFVLYPCLLHLGFVNQNEPSLPVFFISYNLHGVMTNNLDKTAMKQRRAKKRGDDMSGRAKRGGDIKIVEIEWNDRVLDNCVDGVQRVGARPRLIVNKHTRRVSVLPEWRDASLAQIAVSANADLHPSRIVVLEEANIPSETSLTPIRSDITTQHLPGYMEIFFKHVDTHALLSAIKFQLPSSLRQSRRDAILFLHAAEGVSGTHFDESTSFLFVISGEKRVSIAPPTV